MQMRSLAHPVRRGLVALTAAGFLTVSTTPATAQTIWTGMERPEGLQLELHRPEFDGDEFGGLTSVWFLGGRLRGGPEWTLVGELPMAYADATGLFDATEVAIGAPYLGVEHAGEGTLIEAGLRIPIASENFGAAVGSTTEIVDRLGAFNSGALVVNATGTVGGTSDAGFTHRLRGGPRVLVPTGGGDFEIFVDYGGVIGYAGPDVGLEGGVVGWFHATGDGEIGERTVHQAGIQAYRPLEGGGRLGLLLRLPLDHDTSTALEFTIGAIAVIPTG